jgi:hypothetical protein
VLLERVAVMVLAAWVGLEVVVYVLFVLSSNDICDIEIQL